MLKCCSRFALAFKASYQQEQSTEQVTAAYNEEIARVKNTPVFLEILVKHQKNLEAMLAALPEEEREAARQRLTTKVP